MGELQYSFHSDEKDGVLKLFMCVLLPSSARKAWPGWLSCKPKGGRYPLPNEAAQRCPAPSELLTIKQESSSASA